MNVGKYLLLTMTVALLTSLPYTFTENMFITQTGIFVLTPMATELMNSVSYCNMVNYTTSFEISKVVVTQSNSTNATVGIIEEYYG